MKTVKAKIYDSSGKELGVGKIMLYSKTSGRLKSGKEVHKKSGKWRVQATGSKLLKGSGYQTGKTDKVVDKTIKAMPPGKRRSVTGNVYFENRKNRSDLKGGI